jgi:DNA-binding NarL/FixJ family response regulator
MTLFKPPCVLVLKPDVLLKRAFVSLLTAGNEFEVVVSEAKDLSELADDIFKIGPDIVFLSESMPLAKKETLIQLIVIHPGIKVVLVSEDSNWLHIFNKEDRLLTSLDDLLPIINSA